MLETGLLFSLKMNYKIYTGFVKDVDPSRYGGKNSQEFFETWYDNTRKYINDNIDICILGPHAPDITGLINTKIIAEYDNLGHVGDYLHGRRVGRWCGWTSAIVLGMIHAYVSGTDFVYKEQDCLAFGNYVQQMYEESQNCDIIYGSCRIMGVAQSLFLAKRDAIPDIIASLSKDDDKDILPEFKFSRLPVRQTRLSFGYDRDRPFNIKDPIFYIQQISKTELETLHSNKLI
jgi:hypothetical protein